MNLSSWPLAPDTVTTSFMNASSPIQAAFALVIDFTGDEPDHLLPLLVNLVGGRSRPIFAVMIERTMYMKGRAHSWDSDLAGLLLQYVFKGFPLLQVADAILLHRLMTRPDWSPGYCKDRDTTVAPRVFCDTWFLTPGLEPESCKDPPNCPVVSASPLV